MDRKQSHRLVVTVVFWLCAVTGASAHSGFIDNAMNTIDASVMPCGSARISARSADKTAAFAEIAACTRIIDAATRQGAGPDRASALDERARTYAIVGELQKSLADNDAAIFLDPSVKDHYDIRIWIDLFEKDFDALISDATRGLNHFKGDPSLMLRRAWAYMYVHNYAAAISSFNTLVAGHPSIPAFHNGRCEVLALAGRALEALQDCNLAVMLPHNGSAVNDTLGYVFLRLQRWQDAVIQYGQVLRMEPSDAKARYGMGLAKYRVGTGAGGAADIEAARKSDPQIEADFARDP